MIKEKNIEYMRVIACLGVVLIHLFKSAHDICKGMTQAQLFGCSAIVNNFRWCVPVFLMISGYLLLNPQKEMPISKIVRYIVRIAVVLAVFGTGFSMIELVFDEKTFNISMVIQAFLNMLQGDTWNHLWYLYTLIVLYAFLPLLRGGVAMCKDVGTFKFICLVMFIWTSILPFLESCGIKLGIYIHVGSVYMLYMLLGYAIKNQIIKIPTWISVAGVVCSVIYLVGIAYCGEIIGMGIQDMWINHASIAVIIQSVSVFSLLLNLREIKNIALNQMMLSIAETSFGIYILHMFYINLIYKAFGINPADLGLIILIPAYIVVFILTYITVWLLRKCPLIRKYI